MKADVVAPHVPGQAPASMGTTGRRSSLRPGAPDGRRSSLRPGASPGIRGHGRTSQLAASRGAGRLFLAVVLLLILAASPAYAENLGPGGGTRVIAGDQVIGPYRLYITSSPEPASVGTVTYVVRVSDPDTGEKIKDVEITVQLTHSPTNTTLEHAATHADAGNPIDYAAHIVIEQAGTWDGTIVIHGPAGRATVTFLQRVSPPRGLNTVIAAGIPFLVILGVLIGLWVARSGHSGRQVPGG